MAYIFVSYAAFGDVPPRTLEGPSLAGCWAGILYNLHPGLFLESWRDLVTYSRRHAETYVRSVFSFLRKRETCRYRRVPQSWSYPTSVSVVKYVLEMERAKVIRLKQEAITAVLFADGRYIRV